MTHSSTRAGHGRGSAEPREDRAHEEAEHTEGRDGQGAVDRSRVGWRYGSALAAARALNARPSRA